jgi:hypothetical protein
MTMLSIFVTLAPLSVCQKQQEGVPYDEYDLDEENGGQDPGDYYHGELAATGMFDFRDVSAALSVRNTWKLGYTTRMMTMRRMAVKTLTTSTMVS